MSHITLTVDGIAVSVPKGTSILAAAEAAGIKIPRLCYSGDMDAKALCRICAVEVRGKAALQAACSTEAANGMEILTKSDAAQDARRDNLRLLLSRHPMDCQSCARLGNSRIEDLTDELCGCCFYCDCVRDGDCELQELVKEMGIDDMVYEWKDYRQPIDESLPSISRDAAKCVLCRRCVEKCGTEQGVYVWNVTKRGIDTAIGTFMDKPLSQTACVECGQCIRHCPVGALYEHQELDDILDAAQDRDTVVVARAEPHFLRHYLEVSAQKDSGYTIQNLAAGARRLRIDKVVGNARAEEKHLEELRAEILANGDGPIIGASCPAAVSYVEKLYPELLARLSKTPSPQQIFGEEYSSAENGKRVYTVSLTPCSAKKAEAARADKRAAVSQVMSHRELHRLFTRTGVELGKLPPQTGDAELEAHTELAAAAYSETPVTKELDIGGRQVKAAAAYGLRAVNTLLEQVSDGALGDCGYIQILACPDGCISTGALLI